MDIERIERETGIDSDELRIDLWFPVTEIENPTPMSENLPLSFGVGQGNSLVEGNVLVEMAGV